MNIGHEIFHQLAASGVVDATQKMPQNHPAVLQEEECKDGDDDHVEQVARYAECLHAGLRKRTEQIARSFPDLLTYLSNHLVLDRVDARRNYRVRLLPLG